MARKPKLDTILAEAVDTARGALAEIAGVSEIGEHLGVTAEGERLVTHRFVSHKKGYQGWSWFATLARVSRAKSKDLTVCEVGIIAGEHSLLAPAWVPWADRLAKEEIEAAKAEEAGETSDEDTGTAASAERAETEPDAAVAEDSTSATEKQPESDEAEDAESDQETVQTHKSPARRQVRRRRTAQRTAARRRAAQRNRTRKEN